MADLPEYMSDHLHRLITSIEQIDYVKAPMNAVGNDILAGAIEAKREWFERTKSVPSV